MLSPEKLAFLRECSRDDAAFQKLVSLFEEEQNPSPADSTLPVSPEVEHLDMVLQALADGVMVLNEAGLIIYVNQAAAQLMGYTSAKSLLHRQIEDILQNFDIQDDSGQPLQAKHLPGRQCLKGIQVSPRLIRFHSQKDNCIHWLMVKSTPVFENGDAGQDKVKMAVIALYDYTEQKRMEEHLRQSEQRFRTLFSNVPVGMFETDCNGDCVFVNDRWSEITGLPLDKARGQGWGRALHPADRQKINEAWYQAAKSGSDFNLDYRFQKPDGSISWVHGSAAPLHNKEGAVTGYLGIVMDITERQYMEDALANTLERYRQMFENNLAIKLLIHPDSGRIMDANQAAAEFYGYSRDTLKTMQIQDINTLSDEQVYQEMQLARQEKRMFFQFRHRLASGEIRDVEVYSGPVNIDEYQLLFSIIMDVTERNCALAALRESEERFRQIAQNIQEVVYVLDIKTQKMIYISPAYEKLWGHSCKELYNNPHAFMEAVHPDDYQRVLSAFVHNSDPTRLNAIQEKTVRQDGYVPSFEMEYRIIQPSGKIRWVWSHMFPVENEQSDIYRLVGLVEDITERKKAEQRTIELEVQKSRMAILSRFIQDASHEFRTPLAVINTRLYLMEREEDPEERHQYVKGIKEQIEHIVKLVDALVIMSNLDGGAILDSNPLDVNELLRYLYAGHIALIESNQLTVELNLVENLPPIMGDFEELNRAFKNILENAIRYTPINGKIRLASFVECKAEHSQIVVEIHDTGIGIADNVLSQIFERFFRVDDAHSTRGFGLGLPIASKIVRLHGGQIEVESIPEKGSCFRVILPVTSTPPEAATPHRP